MKVPGPISESGASINRTWHLIFLITAAILPSIGVVIYFFVTPTNSIWSPIFYYGLKALQFSLPILYLLVLANNRPEFLSFYKKPQLSQKSWWVSGIIALLFLVFPVISYFLFLKNLIFIETVRSQILDNLTRLNAQDLKSFLILAIGISVVHSFLEEYYWRGFVDPLLRKILPRLQNFTTYFIGSLLFTLHHLVLIYKFLGSSANVTGVLFFGIFVFIPGLVWSYQMDRTKSIYPSWISHIAADLGLMFIGALIVGF